MRKIVLYIVILIIAHFSLTIEDCEGQWYQVNLPIASPIQRIQFVNQNTGWLIMYNLNLLKTTNSGINWTVATDPSSRIFDFQFINDTLGYGMGTNTSGSNLLLKTTNGGYNWTTMQSSSSYALGGFYFVNADTGWVNAFTFPTQSTFMTTDGFQTLNPISTGAGGNPATIYFFKEPYNGGLCGYMSGAGYLWKTTNGGFNWTQLIVPSAFSIDYFSFINKDTGWVTTNFQNTLIYKTTNGGMNWNSQFQIQNSNSLSYIFAVNSDKIWCGVNQDYLLVSTNGGVSWGKQFTPLNSNGGVYMYDTSLGFAWSGIQLVRTTNGGGPITAIIKLISTLPSSIELKQNYPNPFNPSTNIEFQIDRTSTVELKVFDILGRKVMDVVDSKEFIPGVYKVNLDMSDKNLAGGVYFYKLTVLQKDGRKLFNSTKKMIYNK
ncbi:MAG: YCF48-related protein [Ignavibacteriae bacterium]|nr:YCF48-related protein [Ignavibacteriota bacterium]